MSGNTVRSVRVCMLSHSHYESDNRVIRYAEALAARGNHVDVLALQRSPAQPAQELVHGVHVHRLMRRPAQRSGNAWHLISSPLQFTWQCWQWLQAHGRGQGAYDLIHAHNIPDFVVFAAARLGGTRVILDIHDLVPEFYASKFGVSTDAAVCRALRTMERLSAHRADHVILANHLWLDRYTERNRCADRASVFINHVDETVFRRRSSPPAGAQSPRVLFPGGLQRHQGLDVAIKAIAIAAKTLPLIEFHIYGEGPEKSALIELAQQLGVASNVHFFEPRPLREIADIMSAADLGVVPKLAEGFGGEAYSTKIMEFMAVGVPVVVSSTPVDRYYFNDSIVRFFDSGDPMALATAMLELLGDDGARLRLIDQALGYVQDHGWRAHRARYLSLVDELTAPTGARTQVHPAC